MFEQFSEFTQQFLPEFKIELMRIEPLLKTVKIQKGEFLFREGDVCEFLGLTLKGCLRTFFQKFLRLHAESLAFMLRDKLLSLFKDTPEQRYLKLLQTEAELLQRIPQYYIASYLGVEPESLSRLKRRIQKKAIS